MHLQGWHIAVIAIAVVMLVFAAAFVALVIFLVQRGAAKRALAERYGGAFPGPGPGTTDGDQAASGTGGSVPPARPGTLAERLRELDELHAAGAITAKEHQRARNKLLGGR